MILYHYTMGSSFREIERTGGLKSSKHWTAMDAGYGEGWYFTDLNPVICDMAIAFYCWRSTAYDVMKRIDCYLKFDVDEKILKKTRDHVYIVKEWDDELIKYLGGNKKDKCPLLPCEACDKARMYSIGSKY
ncbi:MAG: hypothetical protein U1D67_07855 [Dehalococcoidia bacterium]|nr:hypothetical protein [Dehalococcoidia bacterium]MDZ4247019.1 hypothetical protein [Dehalococcoidia bacterium]